MIKVLIYSMNYGRLKIVYLIEFASYLKNLKGYLHEALTQYFI